MKKSTLALVTLLLLFISAAAQVTNKDDYDIKRPKDMKDDCKNLQSVLNAAPIDARFGTHFEGDSIFLIHSDIEWFSKAIASKNDGIAIDLVQRQQYQCDNISRFPGTWSHRGFLLPPLYRDQIRRQMRVTKEGFVYVFAGMFPSSIKRGDTEANYILLDNKNRCAYSSIMNLDFQGWQLLENGLYYDTLSREKLQEKYKELSKTLKFNIPFEKNKAEYSQDDIKPMYDSLRMTDYAIKKIAIKAYTSVDGSYERNEKLQQQRARSIVAALQAYQSEQIESMITSSENWVEFLNDISGTQYDAWMTLTKEEIKEKLRSPQALNDLEPFLRNHRKAIIEIQLEKRLAYRESNPEELKKYFEQTVSEKNIDEALYLQQIIFFKIARRETPDQFLDNLEIPEALEYGSLLINNASFLYEHQYADLFEAVKTFEELDRLLPNNSKIRYNLCVLQLQSWLQTNLLIDPAALRKEIEGLRKYKIHDNLIRRLLINYYIILSERHLRNRNYAEKDKAVKFIYDTYKPLKLNDADLVNLSKYFSHYSKFDWARKILEPRISSIDASEDLIFYYLNLTIADTRFTLGPSYRVTMLNAINGNRQRFCDLFNPTGEGGITFQLLNDSYLKKTYCENCGK